VWGAKIPSVAKTGVKGDGLWRTFGVDGNAVETRLFGEKTNPSFIATFTSFDARGRKLAEFGAPVWGAKIPSVAKTGINGTALCEASGSTRG